jgi:predicted enzyme related to lactoylglutathione lyase
VVRTLDDFASRDIESHPLQLAGAAAPAVKLTERRPSVPQRSSFHYVELPVGSLERAQRFYEAVFGWTFDPPPPEHERNGVLYFDALPEVGICIEGQPAPGIKPAIAVDSIGDTLARVEAAGGRSIEGGSDVGDGYTGAFEDSEGNHIGLWAFK